MSELQSQCWHPEKSLDHTDTKFDVTQKLVRCRDCREYVVLREKNGMEVATDLAPAAAFASLMVGVTGLAVAALKRKPPVPVPCPKCNATMLPTSIVVTPGKLDFLAKHPPFSTAEEFYKGCPHCKAPLANCDKCKAITASIIQRVQFTRLTSKTGYQYVQSCYACKTPQN